MQDKDVNPDPPPRPQTGAYFWLPIPPLQSLTWRVLTCHELGFGEDDGHPKIWLAVIPRLAAIWGRDPRAMRRRLGRHCYGLFRGRVTRLEKVYLINHGNDSPIPHSTEAVVQAFNLQGRRVRPVFDDHEQRLPDDVRALARVLGSFLARPDLMPSQRDPDTREAQFPEAPEDGIGTRGHSHPPASRTPPRGRRTG
jgi:hypothetical protein